MARDVAAFDPKKDKDRVAELEAQRARFLQTAAHQLRNPMATLKAICGLLRLQVAYGRPPVDAVRLTEIMEGEVNRLSALLDQLLKATLMEGGGTPAKRERVNLVGVVNSALEPFRVAGGGKHRFLLDGMNQGAVCVAGDAQLLEEVVRNLLSNAVKYSPDGGDVRLSLALRAKDKRAVLSVSDNGAGIPSDQLERVFEGFYRATNLSGRDPGGLGLGLYICRDIVQRHGGRIWGESKEGEGTTFHVELPLCVGAGRRGSA